MKYAQHTQQGGVNCSSIRDQLIIYLKYVNKQTNKLYINKKTTVKAGFNLNSIKNFTNIKTTFKNIFLIIIHIDFIIFCQQYKDNTSKRISLDNRY